MSKPRCIGEPYGHAAIRRLVQGYGNTEATRASGESVETGREAPSTGVKVQSDLVGNHETLAETTSAPEPRAVTNEDFTVQWHANGIFTITFTAA